MVMDVIIVTYCGDRFMISFWPRKVGKQIHQGFIFSVLCEGSPSFYFFIFIF